MAQLCAIIQKEQAKETLVPDIEPKFPPEVEDAITTIVKYCLAGRDRDDQIDRMSELMLRFVRESKKRIS